MCDHEPCAARPIIFVHGFQGSFDDFVPMMQGMVAKDARYDGYKTAGTDDPKSWAARSIPRRQWLFGFDFYLKHAADGRGSYTAGPGRVGSNMRFHCPSVTPGGHLVGDTIDYTGGFTHEYADDLAAFVADVQRATGATRIDLVGHSMGGMIVRSYLAYYGGSQITDRALLLSSPIRGVSLISFLELFPVTGPSWQGFHEIAELDGGSIASRVHFSRCGETDKGPFGVKLLAEESDHPPPTQFYVMSGGSDIEVPYDTADHPMELSHEVVPGASHSGILKDDLTRTRATQLLGGAF